MILTLMSGLSTCRNISLYRYIGLFTSYSLPYRSTRRYCFTVMPYSSILADPVFESAKIRDPSRVEALLRRLRADKLQVIADFDFTLTRHHRRDGSRFQSSWSALEESSLFDDSYRAKTRELFNRYYPYEIDHKLSIPEKIPLLDHWYETSYGLLFQQDITKHTFQRVVADSSISLRFSVRELIDLSEPVPFSILSAGMGEVVKEYVNQNDLNRSNLRILGNFLNFDESSGKATSIIPPLVNVFNKHKLPLGDSDKKHVLLLGDSLGDLHMADDITGDDKLLLTVGFLNHKFEDYIDKYMESYDIVLVDDHTMDVPIKLLTQILSLK